MPSFSEPGSAGTASRERSPQAAPAVPGLPLCGVSSQQLIDLLGLVVRSGRLIRFSVP
jgi:hypothetical protein